MRSALKTVSKLVAPVGVALLAMGGAAWADGPLDGRGLAPYRFNPAPPDLSPAEEALGQAYRTQLQGKLTVLERQQLRSSPLGKEQLRGARRELDRVERLLNDR